MKHNLKITAILLSMFIVTQLIGLYVVNYYSPAEKTIPFGLEPPQPQQASDYNWFLSSIIFAFIIAVLLLFLFTKLKLRFILKAWFLVVVTLALAEEQRIISMLQSAVQNHLDDGARLRMYDGILSACSYVNSTDPVFSAEGLAYCEWRDGCWRKCYEVLNACQNALRVIPTSEELINELPILILS